MAERSVKRNEYVLDPMFHIPDGVDEFIYDYEPDVTAEESDDLFGDDTEEYLDDSNLVDESEQVDAGLPVPEMVSIVSQTLRTSPDGSQVVDLIIDVEEFVGISEYQFRVTKI